MQELKTSYTVSFIVPGRPKGKARPRFSEGCVYTPRMTRDYERLIAACAKRELRSEKLRGSWDMSAPASVEVRAYFPVPKAWAKWKKAAAHFGMICPTRKPDVDNVLKAVLDGLNGVVYKDDAQVFETCISKLFEPEVTEYPAGHLHVEVTIFPNQGAGGAHG